MAGTFKKDLQYYKFCAYGFLKNLRFFEPFLILFLREKGFSFLAIGSLYSIREIAVNILEIPTGIASDVVGRRTTMVFSFIAYILSFLLFTLMNGYALIAAAMVLFAFGEAFRTGTHKAIIFEYLRLKGWENQKVYYYGNTRSVSQIGSAVSSLIAAAIVFTAGTYRTIFLFSIIPYLLDLLLMLTYPKALDGGREGAGYLSIGKRLRSVLGDFAVSFKDRRILEAIANLSFFSGFYEAAKDYLQPVLSAFAVSLPVFLGIAEKQRTSLVIGIVYSLIFLLTSFAARNSGRIADRVKNLVLLLNVSLIGGYLFGAVSGGFLALGLSGMSIIFYIGVYVVQNIRRPMGVAYVSDMMNPKILATALSVESQVKTLSAAILAPVIGFLADRLSVGYALLITAAVLLLLSPLYFLRKRQAEQT